MDQLPLARELGVSTATQSRTLASAHHNLPVQLTSFIGRKKEIIDVIHLLEKARLVTLLGPGGTGKKGKVKRAARLFAWAGAMHEKLGDHRPPVEQNSVERDLAVIRSKVDESEFANFSAEGRTMTVEQAIALALDENSE